MQRRVAFAGSIAIHVVVGAALLTLRARDVEVPRKTVTMEIVHTDPALFVEIVELAATGGGGAGGESSVSRQAVAKTEPRRNRVTPAMMRTITQSRALSDSLAEIATESHDSSTGNAGDGRGEGGGHGAGPGASRGIGLGDGAVITEQPNVATPAAPRASKARPAKLIYPSRESVAEAGKLFVARVTVDADGYVVGARLVQGFGGPRADQAGGLIFRFRYAPALDDDGRPIRSTLDQQFLVGD